MTPVATEDVVDRDMDTVEGRLGKLEMASQATYTKIETEHDDNGNEEAAETVVGEIESKLHIEEVDPLGVDLPQAIALMALSLEQQQINIGSTAERVLRQLTLWAAAPEKATVGDALDGLSALLLTEGLQTREAACGLQSGGAEWTDGRLTAAVALTFRPLLVDLVARWAAEDAATRVFARLAQEPLSDDAVHMSVAYAAGLLAGTAPQISGMAMEYFSARAPVCLAEQALGAADDKAAEQTLVVAWRLLRQIPEVHDMTAWDWRTPLTALMATERGAAVRVLACECMALAMGLTESARAQLATQQQLDLEMVVRTRAWLEGGSRRAAVWLGELTATQNRGMRRVWQAGGTWVGAEQLSSGVASVGGVLLAAHSGATDVGLVVTERVAQHVHAAALATARREAVLVQGAAGSGKTALVEWLARRTGNTLVTLHVGGNMDAKVLLGSYVAAQRAGSFEWRAGLLATAVAQGQWVLVEGVDQAPADVVQTLLPLVESHTLFVPSRGEAIRAHPRFRLFATLAGRGRASGDALVGSSMWTRVTLLPPHDDHAEIVAGAFPRLASEAAALARVFASVVAATATRQTSGIVLGTRDLIRWCARLSHRGMNDAFAIFQDAVDVFAAREPDHVRWRALVRRIGVELGVGADRADHYVDQHSPQVAAGGRELTAGRARLALGDVSTDAVNHMPFADTRHARCLLEQIAACVQLAEPALLLGETGTGKTTAVQRLAALAGRRLTVFNLSQQSDAADLLGGFRPVDVARVALQLRDEFDGLFARTLSVRKNAAFLDRVRAAFGRADWRRLSALFRAGAENAQQMVLAAQDQLQDGPQRKRPRLALDTAMDLAREWDVFMQHVTDFEAVRGARVAFRFVEGALAQAARTGAWLLLDEVNLAAPETLACLGGLLQRERMLLLPETGACIACHADFRLFACMNPATDVGKRDLPPALRSGFTELFVHSPDAHADDLLRIIHAHLPRNTPDTLCHRVITFYRAAKALAVDHRVVDGAGQRPHYSLRTLVRALTYARDHAAAYSLRRALYDGLVMTFATQLEGQTQPELLRELHAVFDGAGLAQLLRHVPPAPSADSALEQGFWLAPGSEGRKDNAEVEYVVTESVEVKIGSLARAVMCGRYPVLIQGPTSAGKTSMVEHLARRTGHRFVRINNHEHTDLQEYLGAYVTRDGRLVFEEGLLVQALRRGHWLVLDELNLAPSDVLEALNRLLDDNRELVIPETQEVVRPHPHFMLFATQNPAGLYGGRKQLSRAFRNRFVELHFDDIPARELQRIVVESCRVPPSHAQLLVDVYGALTQARAHTRIFEARHGFITLRDLFRWARRGAASRDVLAEHGYMLLAERTRSADDRSVVRHAIERVFYPRAASGAGSGRVRRAIDVDALYSEERLHAMPEFQALSQASDVAWTSAMRRLFVLTALCLRFDEPVLLVGETGTGKTTVCQLLATALGRQLHAVSCHQNTEAADVLGAQRPVRNRNALVAAAQELLAAVVGKEAAEQIDTATALAVANAPADDPRVAEARKLLERAEAPFAWHDGPLVQAMHGGGVFLMDELNLADDSVLERLNSVLEPSRTLVLAEQAGARELRAAKGFAFVATMNPGGDYGKRELSPALRNRFTELWAPATADAADLRLLLSGRLGASLDCAESERCADVMLAFVTALRDELHVLVQPLSLRDYLAWADFVARSRQLMDVASCVVHGACLVLLDAIGTQGAALNAASRAPASVRTECVSRLRELVRRAGLEGATLVADVPQLGVEPARLLPATARVLATVQREGDSCSAVGVAPFFVETGALAGGAADGFALHAPTTLDNATRVLRAMHVGRAVLLEGSPGVGKTALVSTLARVAGHRLERINLSDQTDIMDLFGTDVPAAGGGFAWRDAPFLQALRRGDWVLLDEINLASQSVLEGLNSCLDHRGAVYITELDREFAVARGCRIFAAQNPLAQGGGRKGLPRSFVNRFTAVHVAELQRDDLQAICDGLYGATADSAPALEFNWQMHQKTMVRRQFGAAGAPWEFNLRDVSRLMELARAESPLGSGKRPSAEAVLMLYVHRMRSTHDRDCVRRLYFEVFGRVLEQPVPPLHVTAELLQIGGAVLPRLSRSAGGSALTASRLRSLHAQLPYAESLARCLEMRWMPILVGASGTGKTALVRWLAQATGNHLVEFSMNAAVDTSELLGGFEQVDLQRHRAALLRVVDTLVDAAQTDCDFSSAAAMRLARMCNLLHRARQEASEHLLERVEELLVLTEELFVNAGDQLSEEHLAQAEKILTHAGSGAGTPPDSLTLVKLAAAVTRRRLTALQQLESAGRFEWVDGVLVEALERGHWLLVDRANLCSAAVLDRLNGLLEPGGVLHVNEDPARTSPVVPHPRFRMILAVDPHYGELSRAMRNRGVEICLLPAATTADCAEVAHAVGLDRSLVLAAVAKQPLISLAQHAMHAAECIQRGAVVELVDAASAPLLLPAPQLDARDAATTRAWWLVEAVGTAQRAGDGGLRLLLAALSTLPPYSTAPEALLMRAMLPADTAVARALAPPESLANAVVRARTELAHSSGISHTLLAAAPLWLELNPGMFYALDRHAACDGAAVWHSALLATLLFWRERALGEFLAPLPDPGAARELVLKRPNVDAVHTQALFAMVDGCAGLVVEWEALAATWYQTTEATLTTSDLTTHVQALRSLHSLAHRLVALISGEHAVTASEQAVALEGIQTSLRCLKAAPARVGQQAASLLHAVDRLVLDATHSARIWALLHPTTLPDQQSRDLETTLRAGVNALSDADVRGAAVEALALLYAAAGRKNKDRIVAAVAHFVDLHSLAALPKMRTSTSVGFTVSSDVSPAGIIADIVQLGSWHRVTRLILLAGCLPRNSPLCRQLVAELRGHVAGAAVAQHSPWALLLTRLGWAVNGLSGAETTRALLPLFTDAVFQWHVQLASASDFTPLLDAPTLRLWRPVATELSWKRSRALLLLCPLSDCDDAAAECRALGRSLALFQPSPPSAADQLSMCIGFILLAGTAASTNNGSLAESPQLVAFTERLVDKLNIAATPHAVKTINPELVDCWHAELLRAATPIADVLAPAADALCAALKSLAMEDVCLALVEVAVCVLAVSLPARPVDPAAKAHARSAWLADDITTVTADFEAYQIVQRSMTGESDTLATRPFANRLVVLEKQRNEIELVYRPRASPDGSRFAELWQDAQNLLTGVLGRVRSTCRHLIDTKMPPGSDVQTLTATLDQFETRARSRYFAAFRDVAQLWCLCVRQANFGLTQLAELRRVACAGRTRELAQHVHDLYRLPMADVPVSFDSNRRMLQALSQLKAAVYSAPAAAVANPLKAYGELSTTLLTRIVVGVQVRGLLAPADLEALDAILRDAYEIHKRAVDEQRRRDAEAASLFKFQGSVEQTDEQLLSEIFPGYDDIYDDLADDSQKPDQPSFQDISEETVATIAASHQYLMLQFSTVLSAQDVRHAQITAAQRHALLLACSLSQTFPELASTHSGAKSDNELRGANLVSLAAAVRAASTAENKNGSGALAGVRVEHVYDFYKDPATNEAALLKPLALTIASRAQELLQEWPDHAVLLQIRDMAQRLLQQPVTAPLAKLLSGLELLHTRAQDWEAYASRDVSIAELHDAAQLIIRWRQQELNSWPHLLRAQELAFARRPNELWFGLYAALVVPERVELSDLAAAVDQFLQGSPAGEFHGRLNMLWAFARHRSALLSTRAVQEHNSAAQALRADSVYGPLTNAIQYYLQYSTCIAEHLDRTNQAVRKDLAQYVRISSWKDVNPAALRASAQKTHKHLTKCVRRWREALSQPIFQITQIHQSAAIATVRIPQLIPVSLPLRDKGFEISPTASLSTQSLRTAAPWDDAADGGVPEFDTTLATSAATLATSAAVAKVLEASPLTLIQLHRLMSRAPVFSQPLEHVSGALEAFAGQIVADISHFQSVETPKHLTKSGTTATAANSAVSSKKRIIRSKKQQTDETETEHMPDEEERQRLIQQFWGEQRNQRRTRLKEILKAMQQLGLRRHFRAAVESSDTSDSAETQPGNATALKGLAPVLLQPPLDVVAWREATIVAASANPATVSVQATVALDNWQHASAAFFRLSAQLAQLRTATFEDHSPEVGAQQIQHITSLMECLNHHVVRDRQCASELLSHASSWLQAAVPWTGLADFKLIMPHVVPDPVELKQAVDETVALLEQLLVAVQMITDAGIWDADCAAAATQTTAVLSTVLQRVRNAQQKAAVVDSNMIATQMSGIAADDAVGMFVKSHTAADATFEVMEAMEELQAALEKADEIEARLAPGLLEPWRLPLIAATNRVVTLFNPWTGSNISLVVQSQLQDDGDETEGTEDTPAESANLAGQWTIAVMNVWQAIHAAEEQFRTANDTNNVNTWGFGPKELLQRLELMQSFARALQLPAMIGLIHKLTRHYNMISMQRATKWQMCFTNVVSPWICQYSLIVQHVVALYASFHKALVHFALTTSTALTSVIVHGLGSNDVFDTEEGSGQSMQNGTGMGEGSTAGAKNVSDEIEGEDQVEGLQGAEQDPNDDQNDPSRDEDAVEMDNDFDGQLGDADLESDNADSDEEKSDDDDNEDDLDEQVGDVDPTDPTSLDDKLWNDEEKDKSKDEDSKVDGKAQPQNQQSDIVAGDEDDNEDKNADSNNTGEQAEDAENGLSDGSGDEEEESDAEGSELGDQVNQDTLDRMADVEDAGEQLEMPEDLDMDAGDESEEDDGIEADMGGDDLPEDEPIEQRPEDMDEDSAEQADDDVNMDDATEGKDVDTVEKEDDEQMPDGSDEEMQDGSDDAGVTSDHEVASDAEDEDEDLDADGQDKQPGEDAPEDEQAKENSGADKSTNGVDSAMNMDGREDVDPNTAAESQQALSKPSDASTSNEQQQQQPMQSADSLQEMQMQPDASQNQQQQSELDQSQKLNPERTLADVIEKWERRLNVVMRENEPEEHEPPQPQKQEDDDSGEQNQETAPEASEFEHVKQDEHFDKVALADADEQERDQQDFQPMDIDADDSQHEDDHSAEQDDAAKHDPVDQAAGSSASANPASSNPQHQQLPQTQQDSHDLLGAAQMQQSKTDGDEEGEDNIMDRIDERMAAEAEDSGQHEHDKDSADESQAVDIEKLRAELEQETAAWREDPQRNEQALELWQAYTRLTHDLSLTLTEQLRLILTPTQATQLRGDYRTGKRLNMKRIIPYIASDFRKDKIWLRRTKPARREYQVMVAVDNSKSMAQSTQAVELAYETLALVTTALNQLEVGQLAVVSFGADVSLLHPFDCPFDSEAGARVLSRFTFVDDKTDVVQLMDASLQLFDAAAVTASTTAEDLWRLQLVISDGVCQDHARLLRQVRAAMEQRIMTVFIVLDRSAIAAAGDDVDPEKDSIMNTQHVSFVTGSDGKMEMKVERYLDTFPFKYYVVLRDIHGLPTVLAETLRQYFSLVGSE